MKLGHDNSAFAWQLSVLLCCFIGIDNFKLGHVSLMRNMSTGLAVVEIGRKITPFASFKAGNGLKNTLV